MLHNMLRAAAGNRGVYSDEVLADSPDTYFRFLETSGTVADNAGTLGATADAALYGSPTLAQPSLSGEPGDTSILLDGTDDYGLTATNSAIGTNATSQLTVEFLIQFSSSSLTKTPISLRPDATSSLAEYLVVVANLSSAGTITLRSGGVNVVVSGSGYNDGLPHHVWAEMDGTTMRMWIDDVLIGSGTRGSLSGSLDLKVAFGVNYATSPVSSQHFPGYLDEIATYRRILDGARRTARVNLLT